MILLQTKTPKWKSLKLEVKIHLLHRQTVEKRLSCHGDECHKRGVSESYLVPLVRVPLVKVLPVLVFVHHDEVDLPHAVVEEEGVGLVVELGLGAEARLVRELRRLELVHLLLHDVVHDGGWEPRLTAGQTFAAVLIRAGTPDESTDMISPALPSSAS